MKNRAKRGDNQFQQSWLTKFNWVKYNSSTHVTCTVCNKPIAFTTMGVSALESHAKPSKDKTKMTTHQQRVIEHAKAQRSLSVLHFKDVSIPVASTSAAASTSEASAVEPLPAASTDAPSTSMVTPTTVATSTIQPTLDQYTLPLSVSKAEILWAMKVILNHYSLRSCLGISSLFQTMFNDSEVAKRFFLSKTKCGYLVNFGLAPYYERLLLDEILKAPYYTVLFDETLNKIVQEEQMDIYIRYWSEESIMVKTKYLDSQFMKRPNAENVSQAIRSTLNTHAIPSEEMIHASMDGPHTNWVVLKLINDWRKENQLPIIESIGSCGLHIVSGALQTGAEKTGWDIKKVLKAMFNLFHDSPARRDEYIRINASSTFPERFCPTRWVENESVSDRAIDVWDNVVAVINHYEKLTISKRPQKNKSYDTLVLKKDDISMKVKFCIFRDIAHRLNTFLVKFQTDAPMLPFLADTLETMLRDIMRFFISKSALDKASTQTTLLKLDVTVEGGLCVPISDVKLPTASKSKLKRLKLNSQQKDIFLKEYRRFLIGMTVKLQERSPLNFAVVRAAASLDPVKMVSHEDECVLLFGNLVDILFEHKRLTSFEGDEAKDQYKDFMAVVVHGHADVFRTFNHKTTRLDTFLYPFLGGDKSKYKLLWKVSLFIMTLSHGQATIERGFNVNKEVLVENLAKESIRSQRLVYDHLKSVDKLHEVPIPRELVISCKNARQKYTQSLEAKQDQAVKDLASNKRKMKMDEVVEVKRTKTNLDKVIVTLKADIEQACINAYTKENFEAMKTELEKANALRTTLKSKETTSEELKTALNKLEEELKEIV